MHDDAATPARPETADPAPAGAGRVPSRGDAGHAPPRADGEHAGGPGPQIEEMLVSGLDRYFAGRHEEAIHIWTRVLFIDRGHMRARAYIERARLAVAERQREHEILLQDGVDALGRGDTGAAREMLARSVRDAGPDDRALAALAHLERLHHASHAPLLPPASAPAARPAARRALSAGAWISLLLILALSAGAAAVALGALGPVGWRGAGARPSIAAAAPAPLPVITSGEAALVRARVLRDRGDLRGAAQALASVAERDAARDEADRLLIEIQNTLLAQVTPAEAAVRPR